MLSLITFSFLFITLSPAEIGDLLSIAHLGPYAGEINEKSKPRMILKIYAAYTHYPLSLCLCVDLPWNIKSGRV
jgi:hypothetical protein